MTDDRQEIMAASRMWRAAGALQAPTTLDDDPVVAPCVTLVLNTHPQQKEES